MKLGARIVAGLLALLLFGMACAQLMGQVAYAKGTVILTRSDDFQDYMVTGVYRSNNSSPVDYISRGIDYDIEFTVYTTRTLYGEAGNTDPFPPDTYVSSSRPSVGSAWRTSDAKGSKVEVTLTDISTATDPRHMMTVKLSGLEYRSTTNSTVVSCSTTVWDSTNNYAMVIIFNFSLDESYVNRYSNSGDGGSGDSNPYTSNIVIESVVARDANDLTLTKIDKDTPPFTIDITYSDYGLREVGTDLMDNAELNVYLVDSGGFIPTRGNRGTLRSIVRDSNDVPRFRATFTGITYDGGSSTLSLNAQYVIDGWYVGGDATARVYAASDEEDDDDETAPPTPYIIVNRYSYGGEPVEAGASFTLEMGFSNTSTAIDLENIVMTVTPAATSATEGDIPLSIASASNTYYYTALPANATISQTVDLNVKPDSSVGSAGVQIAFTYEYIVDKTRESNTTSVDIAIPITQIDRFAVDPITDYSSWVTAGETGYVTITFVNRGKSPTYNVSGYIVGEDGAPGQTQHYGNLNAGENGYLDFDFTAYEIGEQTGTIVLSYEDENSEQKELSESFTYVVEEPWYGGWEEPEDPGMWGELEEEPGTPTWKIVLLVVGGLAIAAPIALYVTKRVWMKGKEDFDEDF